MNRTRQMAMAGFSLLEVMVALVLIGMGVLSVAPMFMYAIQSNTAGADLGGIGAIAVERLELLRGMEYSDLVAGGDVDASTAGYFDNTGSYLIVRWSIVDNVTPAGSKTITVRAISEREVMGKEKQFTVITMRGVE